MISRKMKEQVFTLDDGADIDFQRLELQFSDLTLALDSDKKEDKIIEETNQKYTLDDKQS